MFKVTPQIPKPTKRFRNTTTGKNTDFETYNF